jgi:hypothetical protein
MVRLATYAAVFDELEKIKTAGEMPKIPEPPKFLDSSTREGNLEKAEHIEKSLNKVLDHEYGDKR